MTRIALIGAGPWAARYAATINLLSGVQLRAVVSTTRRNRGFGAQRWLRSVHDIDPADVDGAIVATSADSHAEVTCALLTRRIPVLVEKPMALSAHDARRMRRLSRTRRTLLMVAHTQLYGEAFASLKQQLAASSGPLLSIDGAGGNTGPYRDNCEALWDYGAHDVSMILALAKRPPTSVWAKRVASPLRGVNTRVALEFAVTNAHPAPLTANFLVGNAFVEKRRYLAARVKQGTFVLDDLTRHKLMGPDGQPIRLPDKALPLTRTLAAFVHNVRRRRQWDASADLGVEVCRVLERASKSSRNAAT